RVKVPTACLDILQISSCSRIEVHARLPAKLRETKNRIKRCPELVACGCKKGRFGLGFGPRSPTQLAGRFDLMSGGDINQGALSCDVIGSALDAVGVMIDTEQGTVPTPHLE